MGHSTASGRAERRLSEAFGISDEEMTRRSQLAIQSLKPPKPSRGYRDVNFTVASVATNRLFFGSIFANLEGGGYTVSLTRSNGNGTSDQIIRFESYDNLTKAKNAIYEATQVPKPRRGRS